ncbi:MAG: UDP-N-acetylmuramoyl-tripeptide--D-alanyl-D-alanine ligase [Planctomycetota bacterium]
MIPMLLGDVAAAIGAAYSAGTAGVVVRRVTTDSRDVREGDLFFALRGVRFDGHQFAAEALAKGAVACVCDRNLHPPTEAARFLGGSGQALVVENTLDALGRLAKHYRHAVLPVSTVVIAVTGSNGKTTTKCMIDHVLGGEFKGRASPKSFNNAIGVPLTLLSADADDRYLVVEIGTNAPGEVASLAALTSPNVAVITSIGEAHLEGLGDIHAVAVEKTSLLRFVRPAGFAVVNVDRPEVLPYLASAGRTRLLTFGVDQSAKLCVARRRADLHGTAFELERRYRVELPMPGAHHATNAAAAFAVARWFGVAPQSIAERLQSFRPPEGRTQLAEIGGVKVVDDAYNANPASVAAAVEALRGAQNGRRVFVLGDMLELGVDSSASHRRVVRTAVEAGIEVLVAVGPATVEAARASQSEPNGTQVYCCEDVPTANEVLDALVTVGDTVWIKGSRGMELDRIVRHLQTRLNAGAGV